MTSGRAWHPDGVVIGQGLSVLGRDGDFLCSVRSSRRSGGSSSKGDGELGSRGGGLRLRLSTVGLRLPILQKCMVRQTAPKAWSSSYLRSGPSCALFRRGTSYRGRAILARRRRRLENLGGCRTHPAVAVRPMRGRAAQRRGRTGEDWELIRIGHTLRLRRHRLLVRTHAVLHVVRSVARKASPASGIAGLRPTRRRRPSGSVRASSHVIRLPIGLLRLS